MSGTLLAFGLGSLREITALVILAERPGTLDLSAGPRRLESRPP